MPAQRNRPPRSPTKAPPLVRRKRQEDGRPFYRDVSGEHVVIRKQRGGVAIAALRITVGHNAGDELVLDRPPVTVGTHRSNDLVLQDEEVSRRHFAIDFTPAGWLLTDLDSTNGTWVDGRKVLRAELKDGTKIEVGESTLFFVTPPRG